MTTTIIILFILSDLLFVSGLFILKEAKSEVWQVVAMFFLTFILSVIITLTYISIKLETSINYLNNEPVYEKQYVIDNTGKIVDSIYVKIKPVK